MKAASRLVVVASLASVLATMPLQAHEGMHGPGGEYDADHDESLSLAEYRAYLKDSKQDVSNAATRFAALDTNKDGKLSSAEFIRGLNAGKTK